ncbi:TetR/AcrR family transcriptional regulator [Salibacterium halotolerans]|uniref:DNA-binding transcriptional regulator, AcrR family n=1 Tax=Salibacterium halotolerans TaxID=1884432 RepID=A0A1I5SB41_9BACI|nr:TetR/AcrR family transcriptional regulator [Salibacterium halotolerans]SFP67998.1 DNA-binding transcriptional regulator, AcrR family [Salibacterium halotolerans]
MKSASKKEIIMDTAESLFYQHGFHAVGVKSILDQVGVAPMTMYYHFQSKEILTQEILKRRGERYIQFLDEKINRENSLTTYVDSLIKAHMDWLKNDGFNGCLFLRAKQEYEGINEEIAAISKGHKQRMLNTMEKDVQLFGASSTVGKQLFMILEGITSAAQISSLEEVEETAGILAKNLYTDM